MRCSITIGEFWTFSTVASIVQFTATVVMTVIVTNITVSSIGN